MAKTNPVSELFRKVAGLPERKDDKPQDLHDIPTRERATEPEGGYGGGEDEKPAKKGKK